MAMFKPYKLATAAQLEQLPKVAGQFIVVEATGAIYYDKDTTTRVNLAKDAYTLTINGSTVSLLDGSNTAVSTATIPSVVNAVSWNNEAAPSINSFDCYNKTQIDAMFNALTSYIIEGYLDNGVFYEESTHTTAITGAAGIIYTDLTTNKLYRYDGSAYVEVSAGATYSTGNTSTAGITKLYTSTGNNTDGAMTQAAVTSLIGDIETLMAAL